MMAMEKGFFLALVLVAALWTSASAKGDTWALLVAGSNTWWNYRHQADICHAYHIMRNAGIPENRIITMMYDDIAQNSENPNKGVIINQPGGSDVYGGVVIDYKGGDVTPANFLSILQGNKTAMAGIGSGRVIESDSGDNIFVNFADHGGVGILCFPSEYLYANDLSEALSAMYKENKFNKMVMYVEACEAGSMFDGILPENNKILVSTASAKDESSWGWYCENEMNNCLGDLYSITWMEHMDTLFAQGQMGVETLFHQYQLVRTAVNKSHVQLFGDYSLGFDTVGEYIGSGSNIKPTTLSFDKPKPIQFAEENGVASRDIPIHLTQLKLKKASSQLERIMVHQELTELNQKRAIADETFAQITNIVAGGESSRIQEIVDKKHALNQEVFECYKNLVKEFNKHCMNTYKNTYLVRHFYKLVNLCSVPWTTEKVVGEAMASVCSNAHRNMFGIV